MTDPTASGGTPPEEKTTDHGAPDLGNEEPGSKSSIVETIDEEIPMGGIPGPGITAGPDTGEERTSLTDLPEDTAERDTARRARLDHRHLQQQAGDVAVPRLRVPALRRAHQHLHAVPGSPLREPRPGPDLRHPVHVGVELRPADELADDGAGGVGRRARRPAQRQAVARRHRAARCHVRRRSGLRVHVVLPRGARLHDEPRSRRASTPSPASTASTSPSASSCCCR